MVMSSCGQENYVDARNLPPSGVLNRVMIAQQNPNALPFVDAFYDIRHPYNASGGAFSIAGYAGKGPLSIQNLPEQQVGAVYGEDDGSLALINYAGEKLSTNITIPGGLSSGVEGSPYNGISVTRDLAYVYAANPINFVVSVVDRTTGVSEALNLSNAYGISVNPGGTVALIFIKNATQVPGYAVRAENPASFAVYSFVKLTSAQQTLAINNPNWNGAQDCEPQQQPTWCIFPVSTGSSASFDHPIKAVFSADGTTAYVLNCGPECGGTTASLTTIPITAGSLNPGGYGASGLALVAQNTIPIPGGATDAAFNGNTLYVAGESMQPGGLWGGNLTVLNTPANTIAGAYSISDGTHNRMVFGDDNTLWIGSSSCDHGLRYQQAQTGAQVEYGCLTMFNTSTNKATVGSYLGDATGIAAVTGLHKVYTAQGGQVQIFSTTSMSELNNSNVTVTGTAIDVAYMDATTDTDNTIY
jgi:hypothetical protein